MLANLTLPILAAWMYMLDQANFNVIDPSWRNINFAKVDVLMVGPLGLQPDGTFGISNSTQKGNLSNLFHWTINTARQQNPNIRIFASQWYGSGDVTWGSALDKLSSNASAIDKYADSVGNVMKTLNLDGFDIDWEGQNVQQYTPDVLAAVRKKFNKLSVKLQRPLYITISPSERQWVPSAVQYVDFVNMQTYDAGITISPLYYINNLGMNPQRLLYGSYPEVMDTTPPLNSSDLQTEEADITEEAEDAYTKYSLGGIHVYRLNSGDLKAEVTVNNRLWDFLRQFRRRPIPS